MRLGLYVHVRAEKANRHTITRVFTGKKRTAFGMAKLVPKSVLNLFNYLNYVPIQTPPIDMLRAHRDVPLFIRLFVGRYAGIYCLFTRSFRIYPSNVVFENLTCFENIELTQVCSNLLIWVSIRTDVTLTHILR